MDSDLAKECQNQSYQSENEIPTPFDIKEIKQMLMAGDKHKILKSIKKIEVFSQKDEGLAELISCDISEFLCDAITPFDAITSR